MGGASVGLADDANAVFVNPAGIGSLQGENASITTKMAEGQNKTIVSGVEKTALGALGIGYSLTAVQRTVDQLLIVSYARELNEVMVVPESLGRLAFGSSVKFNSSQINGAQVGATKVNVDVAAIYKISDSLAWGMTWQDLASRSSRSVAAGFSGSVFDKRLTWTYDGSRLGCEWKPVSNLALRAGKDGDARTAGLGLNLAGFAVDYAYVDNVSPVHYFAISVVPVQEFSPKQAGL
jgi:hypothetical protein